jgi:hypothetical protein
VASTFRSRQLRHERAFAQRFTREQATLAREAGSFVLRYATALNEVGERAVPNRRAVREELKRLVWSQLVKPYFVGRGDDPFFDDLPQSPYARLLADGVAGSARLAAERQQALLRQIVRDPAVYAWLTGPRPPERATEQRGAYDPWHRWVDPNGYRLSDRVWRAGIDQRARIDALLDYHIARGTAAVDIARELEAYLTPGAAVASTRTPYGREGSYAARRLARTEITATAGRATVNAAQANPFVGGVRWALSLSHSKADICDDHARGGPEGDGIYPPDEVPDYPAHPHDLCSLQPVAAADTRQLVADFRAEMRAAAPRALLLQGLFDVATLTRAILSGFIGEVIARLAAVPVGG